MLPIHSVNHLENGTSIFATPWRYIPIVTVLSVAMLVGNLSNVASCEESRPNVILVMTDDQGHGDLGFHGNDKIVTPRLDAFASDAIRLPRFYCSPVCAPTRASLMTGRYHYRTGVIHTSRGGAKMAGDETTLAELLAAAGYRTALFGKWHLGDSYPMRPQDQGFTHSLWHRSGGIGQTPDKPNPYQDPLLWNGDQPSRSSGYCTDVFTDAAIKFIEESADQPFFVYLSYNAPHTPLEISDDLVQPYLEKGLSDTTARVYAMVENIDTNFGKVMDTLDRLDLRGNTLVCFLTDNGPQQDRYNSNLRGRKSWVYEGGIRVPCFIQWPDRMAGDRELDLLAAHIDLPPTILSACEVDIPNDVDGVSLLDDLRGDSGKRDDRAIIFQCHRGLTPVKYQNAAVVTQRFKLVSAPGTFSDEDLRASDLDQTFELFDLLADPGEEVDLASQHPEVVSQLVDEYDQWWNDVSSTRDFRPGTILVGSVSEPSTHLCRYQDGTYVEGVPTGWQVEIVQSGHYEIAIPQRSSAVGVINVRWQGKLHQVTVLDEKQSVRIPLEKGEGNLDIWFQDRGLPRRYVTDNSTVGDVLMRRISD